MQQLSKGHTRFTNVRFFLISLVHIFEYFSVIQAHKIDCIHDSLIGIGYNIVRKFAFYGVNELGDVG